MRCAICQRDLFPAGDERATPENTRTILRLKGEGEPVEANVCPDCIAPPEDDDDFPQIIFT